MEQTYTVGVPLTTGYFTAEIEADSGHDALVLLREAVCALRPLFGSFNMPSSPGHPPAEMILEPAHVVGYVLLPSAS